MKKPLFLFLFFISTLTAAYGQSFEVRPVAELVNDIESSKFTYKETGLLFGFTSVQSCMYVAQNMVIFKNYCSPANHYPARGYTIVSAKFGMIDLYEEKFDTIIKRDIIQNEFPQNLAPYLTTPLPLATLEGLSAMMETLYSQYNPGCWSTNWSNSTQLSEVACSHAAGDVAGFNSWAQESQLLVGSDVEWSGLFKTIEKQLSP